MQFFKEGILNRYNIKPEGLGEINIDLSDNGEWVRVDDIEHLLTDSQKTAHNSDYAKCNGCKDEKLGGRCLMCSRNFKDEYN